MGAKMVEGGGGTLKAWLEANKGRVTHFRPVRWCGVWSLVAYDRNHAIPFVDGQPVIEDNKDNVALIKDVMGAGMLEEPHHVH